MAPPARKRRGTERPPKICELCGNTYKYQHALNAHMRRLHTGERPFPCEVCNKAFISNVELRRHMRVHTGQKPYGCRFCERRFSDFGSSKKHERIHTGERPYVCDVCKKGFAYAHVLSVHKRTHTGKKQFQCTHKGCEKGFTKKMYLIAHQAQHRGYAAVAKEAPTRPKREPNALDDGEYGLKGYGAHDERDDVAAVCMALGPLAAANGLVEEAKVLEECIVTNDFMFNDEDEQQFDQNGNQYDDVDDDGERDLDRDHDHDEDAPFEDVELEQHIVSDSDKPPYHLVGGLLDAEDLEIE